MARRKAQLDAGQRPDMSEADMPPAPFIEPEFLWIWRAWHRLHPDRPQHGGGLGPSVPGDIPWTVVRQWAEFYHLSRGEFHMLDRVLQAMDAEYREWWIERHPPEPPAPQRRREMR
jgi:hypothetical protein